MPNGVTGLELSGAEAYSLVYADDKLLGEKITSPYTFSIDNSLWNKSITLRIVQYSSISPIFGDVDYWDKKTEWVGWRGTPSPRRHSFGFKKLYWRF